MIQARDRIRKLICYLICAGYICFDSLDQIEQLNSTGSKLLDLGGVVASMKPANKQARSLREVSAVADEIEPVTPGAV